MKKFVSAALAGGLLVLSSTALADVKAGVDAWNQGDYVKAVDEWRPLALAGDADAQFNIGQAYKLGRGVPIDLPVALEWFRKASVQGHERATDNYGLLLFQQGQREEAMGYIRASAERGEPRAQYVYATALFNGDLAEQDWVRAYALMTRSAQAGVAQATTSLTQMDKYIPEEQRKQGLALATQLARAPAGDAAPAHVAQPGDTAMPLPSKPQVAATQAVTGTPIPSRPPVKSTPPPAAVAKPKPAPTTTTPAAPAKPAATVAGTGKWRVQLGAFREAGRAQALWSSLSGRVTGLSAHQPDYVTTNGLTRLLVGPFASAAEANAMCDRIKPSGTPCMATSR